MNTITEVRVEATVMKIEINMITITNGIIMYLFIFLSNHNAYTPF